MIETTDFHGWEALRLQTEKAELIMPTEVGPRVLHCGLRGQPNLFALDPAQLGGWGEDEWCIRGGHRLWVAPEHETRSYRPDNDPVAIEADSAAGTMTLRPKPDRVIGLAKELRLDAIDAASFRITHTIRNIGVWPIPFGAWALSVMEHGGYAVLPLSPKGEHPRDLLPRSALVPWTYTDFSRPCWAFHGGHIGLDSKRISDPQKLGITGFPGWAAYWQEAGTFVKHAGVHPDGTYPDMGSEFELFGCNWMVELETLSPISVIEPGDAITHVEHWGIFEGLPRPDSEEAFRDHLAPAVNEWLHGHGLG